MTDLTAVKVVKRLEMTGDTRHSWTGVCPVAFSAQGPHVLLVRVVRYHAGEADPFSYVDRRLTIEVQPAR